MASNTAFIAVTNEGFVEGTCFSKAPDASTWVDEMRQAGMLVTEVPQNTAREILFTKLPIKEAPASSKTMPHPGRMIIGRRKDGSVEAAGWDYAETRKDARDDWLERGLTLELVTADQVNILAAIFPGHVFDTTIPVGEVLAYEQARKILAGY